MAFVLVGLGVFMVIKFAREWLSTPTWFLITASVALSALGLWPAGENPGWCPAVAGIALFFYRFDGVLQALRDWFRLQVLRAPRR